MNFKEWLNNNLGKSLKWFNDLPKHKRKRIKNKFGIDKPISCPVGGKDCVIKEGFKLEPGQSFARQITDIGGEVLYLNDTLGQGFIYADLDEGLNLHEGIQHLEKSKRLTRLSFVYKPGSTTEILPNPFDDEEHGSHVVGLVSGRGRIITGLAPEVDYFYQLKIMNDGIGFYDNFNLGLQYLLNLKDDEFPDFIGFSLGMVLPEGHKADDTDLAKSLIIECHKRGAILVGSAGNAGVPLWLPERYTVPRQTFPSSMDEVLAIGNVNWSNVIDPTSSPGEIAYSSNGTGVVSFGTKFDSYKIMSGTSMARPNATGFMMGVGTNILLKEKITKDKYKSNLKQYLAPYTYDLGIKGKDVDYGLGFLSLIPQI